MRVLLSVCVLGAVAAADSLSDAAALVGRGAYDEARPLLARHLSRMEGAKARAERLKKARCHVLLASCGGPRQNAIAQCRQALAIYEALLPPGDVRRLDASRRIGWMYRNGGRPEEAARFLKPVLAAAGRPGDEVERAGFLMTRGVIENRVDDLRAALAIHRKLKWPMPAEGVSTAVVLAQRLADPAEIAVLREELRSPLAAVVRTLQDVLAGQLAFHHGRSLFDAQRFDAAQIHLRESCARLKPGSDWLAMAHFMLGGSLQLKSPQDGLRHAVRAAELADALPWPARTQLRVTAGALLVQHGDAAAGLRWIDRALRESRGRVEPSVTFSCLVRRTIALSSFGERDETLAAARRALQWAERHDLEAHELFDNAVFNLGMARFYDGDVREGLQLMRRGLALTRDPADASEKRTAFSVCLRQSSDYVALLPFYRESIDALKNPTAAQIGVVFGGASLAAQLVGRYDEALSLAETGIVRLAGARAPTRAEVLRLDNVSARAILGYRVAEAVWRDDRGRGLRALHAALEASKASTRQPDGARLTILLGLAGLDHERRGHWLARARVWTEAHPPEPWQASRLAIALANDCVLRGEAQDARAFLEQAVEHARFEPLLQPQAWGYLGNWYRRHGKDHARALNCYGKAISIMERHRTSLAAVPVLHRAAALSPARAAEPHEGAALSSIALGRPRAAVDYLEAGRARMLLDLLQQSRFDPLIEAARAARLEGDDDTARRIAAATKRIHRAELELIRAREAAVDGAAPPRARLERARTAVKDAMTARSGIIRAFVPFAQPVRITTVTGLLQADEALLYYVARHRDAHAILVGGTGKTRTFPLAGTTDDELQAMAATWQHARRGRRARGVGVPRADATARTDELSRRLLPSALVRALREFRHVHVVPHAFLHGVAFEALQLGRTTWLDDGPTVSYVPSASVLAWCRRIRERQRRDAATRRMVALGGVKASGLAPLPGTVAEVRSVERAWGATAVQGLLGGEATEQRLFAAAPGAAIVHLASHHVVDPRDPSSSRLVLTKPEKSEPGDDGALTLSDLLLRWRGRLRRCEVVVLSACATNVGPARSGEAPHALPLGFLYAGAPAVIGSLWRVDDESTAKLFAKFYEELKAGKGKLEAFTEARKWLKKTYPDPYHWAPFVFVGDPR